MHNAPPAFVPTHPSVAALDRLGDEIAELSAHLDAATARLLDLIREFDARVGWQHTGARSCAHWLSYRVGLELGTARERVRVARALGTLPLLAKALARGELSYAKVRALTRVATPETEARLLAVGRAGTAVHVERIVQGWRRVDQKAEARERARRHTSRTLQVYQAEDGMVVVRGRLEPEVGALLMRALEAGRETLYQRTRGEEDPPRPTLGQQQADALALLAETALHHELDPGGPGERYQVVVHVDAPVLADPAQPGQSVLEDGPHVPAGTSQRLACDASRVVMRQDRQGRLVEIGARTRTIPPALRRALLHRDSGCRFPGCGVRVGQGHHLRHWAQGGPTTLSNLALLCRRHHRAVHEEGYQVERGSDGTLLFRRPDGQPLPDVPPPVAVPADSAQALRARHAAQGLRLHAQTARPSWTGERLELGWAIDVLHPLAQRRALRQPPGLRHPADAMNRPMDAAAGGGGGPLARAPRPLRILVADDEPDVAATLAEMLTAAGHEVVTAGDGTAALARLGERPFDLVISDVRMPGLDGPALYRALQTAHPELGHRLIWITGDILNPGTADFVVASGQPILTKPFNREAVLAKIAEAWARR